MKSRPLTAEEWERRYSALMESAERYRDQAEHRQTVILDLARQLSAVLAALAENGELGA